MHKFSQNRKRPREEEQDNQPKKKSKRDIVRRKLNKWISLPDVAFATPHGNIPCPRVMGQRLDYASCACDNHDKTGETEQAAWDVTVSWQDDHGQNRHWNLHLHR